MVDKNKRYGEYVVQLGNTVGRFGGASRKNSSPGGGGGEEGGKYKQDEQHKASRRGEEKGGRDGNEEACRASLRKLDDLWEHLGSSLGFVVPLLKEVCMCELGYPYARGVVVIAFVFVGGGGHIGYRFDNNNGDTTTQQRRT